METAPAATTSATVRGTRRDRSDRIATAISRLRVALDVRPGFGHPTFVSCTDLGDGLRCTTSERSFAIESDVSPALGGEASAPAPGMYVRAALGSCLAIRYRMLAAERGIELNAVRVTVEEECELHGLLCDDGTVPPGATRLRYHVEIESPDEVGEVEALVDAADRLSPVLDDLSRPHSIERSVSIARTAR